MKRLGQHSLLLAAGSLLLLAHPAAAGPRVSLKLERASLHQILVQLRARTGLRFQAQDGSGEDGFKEPAGSKQVKVEWKDETLGHVIREVCGAFDLAAQSMGDGGYWFRPGHLPKRTEVLSGGIAFSLAGLSQSEAFTVTPGTEQPRVQRTTFFRIVCRAEDGDGDIIGQMTRFSVTDETGKVHAMPDALIRHDSSYGLPDERVRGFGMPWEGEHPRHLRKVEGEVELFEKVEERRLAVPLPAKELPPEQPVGAARVRFKKLTTKDKRTECQFTVAWPTGVEVPLSGAGALRALVRLPNGRAERVWLSTFVQPDEQEVHSVDCEFSAQFDAAPDTVEILVPTRRNSGKKVAFLIENSVTPFGRPQQFRLAPLNMKVRPVAPLGQAGRGIPAPFRSAEGGTLRVPVPGLRETDASVEVQVGLSRRSSGGTWSPIRWSQFQAGSEPLRLERLAPGRYRVRVTYWLRRPDQPLQRMNVPERAAEVVIRQGAESGL